MSKERRRNVRIPLLDEAVTLKSNELPEIVVKATDVSETGIYVETTQLATPHSLVSVGFKLPGDLGSLTLMAEVKRVNWHESKKQKAGMGLDFVFQSVNNEKIFKAWCVYIRNKQIITVSKRIVDEFFGPERK